MTSAAAPCVLLVEDDTSITRFVAMALDQLPIELLTCTSVPAAVALMEQRDIQLVITDLMLPGESGISLVQRLSANPQLRGDTLVAVFSAGLTPAVKEQLQGMDLWRVLSKPIAVQELESCVRDALALHALPEADTSTATPAPQPSHSNQLANQPQPRTLPRDWPSQPILVATHNSSPPTVRHVSSSLPPMCKRVMSLRKRKTGLLCAGWPTASPPCSSHWAGHKTAWSPGRWRMPQPWLIRPLAPAAGAICGSALQR